ncbi:MAG: IS1595 family transposase [Mesoflavibacter sp.]|nr:IS1595 family transposase [Mesoflavibacter sp.]
MNVSEQIKELFSNLPPDEQKSLLVELSTYEILESNLNSDISLCPYCNYNKFVKNGKPKGIQRYKCKSCDRNFIASTGTVVQWIRKKEEFEKYKTIMLNEGFIPLKQMSIRLGISIQTSFDWRHKILSSLKPEGGCFEDITEMDDVWFLYSQKGRKGLKYPRKRGGSKRHGDNDFQVKMLITSDRKNTQDFSVARIGRLKSSDIQRKVGKKINESCILVSDKHGSIASFAKKNNIDHISFKSKNHVADKQHHVQTVNNFASRLKSKINHIYRGVSTKYLQCYANWFQFIEANKNCCDIIFEANKLLAKNHTSWNVYTNMETLYRKFIKEYSKRTYRCPTKRQWKTQLRDTMSLVTLSYL